MDRHSSSLPVTGLSALHRRAKQSQHRVTPAQKLQGRTDAAKQLMALLGLGAAGGVGVRGLMGLRDMFAGSSVPAAMPSAHIPQPINLSRRFPLEDEKERGVAMQKAAQTPPPAGGDGIAGFIARNNLIPDTDTLNPLMNSWGIPAGIGAIGGGAYGGYHLLDWLLKKERSQENENAVESAKQDYQKALAEQYRAAMMAKQGEDDLGLGELADCYAEKAATLSVLPYLGNFGRTLRDSYRGVVGHDTYSALEGGVNAAAILAALGTGTGTYNWVKGKNKQELLRKALQKRQQQRQLLSPPPILAVPEDEPENAVA